MQQTALRLREAPPPDRRAHPARSRHGSRHHAWEGNKKGTLLCLWAGGDPHASAPSFRHYYEDEEEEEEAEAGDGSAVCGACCSGHVRLLERFAPDPARYCFDLLYMLARNADVVDLLARRAMPTDPSGVVQELVRSAGWCFGAREAVGALRRLFEHGARWEEASPKDIGEIRRTLLRMDDYRFRELVRVLATADYCSDEVRRELARTPAFQRRLHAVELMPKPGDHWWTRGRWADQAKEVISTFGLDTPFPAIRRSHR